MLLYQIVQSLFFIYTLLLLGRIVSSWIPNGNQYKIVHFIAFYTDPYLNLFRMIIPPIGMLDISAILAFLALRFVEKITLSFIAYMLI
jgi:YggT family protein